MNTSERLREQPERCENIAERIARIESLIDATNARLHAIHPVMSSLLTERHRLFRLTAFDNMNPEAGGSVIDSTQTIADQLYQDLTYNADFYSTDLGLRKGGAIAFHNETEKYNPKPDDSLEESAQKAAYRHAILAAAQQFGFVAQAPDEASHPIDRALGITDSVLEPISTPVEAVIIPGAAGMSNDIRLRGAVRDIESGAVHTNRIIMATCDRPTTSAELIKLARAGLGGGETEFELCQSAVADIAGGYIDLPEEQTFLVKLTSGSYPARLLSGQILVGEQLIRLDILSAPYDPARLMPDGTLAKRTNTEETFLAAGELLSEGPSTLLVESHDAWIPAQHVIAQRIFGIYNDKQVLSTGPLKSDRVFYREDGMVDINLAEAVIDEMTKYYKELVNTRAAADLARNRLTTQLSETIEK